MSERAGKEDEDEEEVEDEQRRKEGDINPSTHQPINPAGAGK